MWSLRLTEEQHAALTELLADQPQLSESLEAALEALEFARWDPLPDAELPWDRVEELAAAQRIDEADVVWDMCAGKANPARSSGETASAKAKRAEDAAPKR